jgi:nucleoside-diphosphate-sugar epimerase
MTAAAQGNFSGKRLVIFGAGYVGAAVAREAVARGMHVTALTRNQAKAEVLRASGMEVVVADLASGTWHGQIAGGADFVLNCVSSGGGGVAGYNHSYLGGMNSILQWASAPGNAAGTLVYTSSTSVYPQGGGITVDETAPTDGPAERPQVLVAAENALRGAALPSALGGLPSPRSTEKSVAGNGQITSGACKRWFILRLAGIYGPGRHHLLEQVRAGEISGRGDFHLNLIHLEDICAAVWAAFNAPTEIRNEILNVADDGAATKMEIVSWIAAQRGIAVPRFTGEPASGRRSVTPDRVISNAKLKAMLAWAPRYPGFREGYAALLRA